LSINPFRPDSATAMRLKAQAGSEIRMAARERVSNGCISAPDVAALLSDFSLPCVEDLMCHLLTEAEMLASPGISNFTVGAVGLCSGSGDLILGGNVEFAGTSLHNTLHGEGFVAIRAFQRSETLRVLALGEAHPCGHCRQTLIEFSNGQDLVLIDPNGYRLLLSDLYPWPFDPAYLEQAGAQVGQRHGLTPRDVPTDIENLLAHTPIHAPYSGAPAALVVQAGGRLFVGGSIENVAFNPTLLPLQTMMVALISAGGRADQITRAWLVQDKAGVIDHAPATKTFLNVVAPAAHLEVTTWV